MNQRNKDIDLQIECIKDHCYKIVTLYVNDITGIKLQLQGIEEHMHTIKELLEEV